MPPNRISIFVALEGSDEGLKRGSDIPFAVLVPKVVLRKRLDVARLVAGRVPRLVEVIEGGIDPATGKE